jgi:CRP-like cAMP-binding protein
MAEDRVKFLAGCAKNVRFQHGDRIAMQDGRATSAWLLRAGRVELRVLGVHVVETIAEGELFGWSALLPPYRWNFDAVAVGPVRALELDGACLRKKCEDDTAFGYEIMMRVLLQAQARLEQTRLQALDLYGGGRR